ncbi:MAG: glycine betaine ABC transporter substrate-binding protein [Nocardioidaceae bacterium]|nr:glycine betaine ABC transporter substrate-binding protein [Nocardioidaceae bacterium]MCL2613145.1 glycine betaine ABC transporter substrate-binding protein [Nocardioidaceae bacterium]
MRRRIIGLVALGLALLLAGCGGLATAGGPIPTGRLRGPLTHVKRLNGASISIGSKNFSESITLGKMALILFKSAGAQVTDLTNIPGSASARQAHLDGDIDAMWDYTGTAWLEYLGQQKAIKDSHKQYEAVREMDLRKNDLVWLPPAPMNNTYAMAVTQASAKKWGLSKLSDIKKVPVAQRTFCLETEFRNRNDGFVPMLKTYGLSLGTDVPEKNIKLFQAGVIYDATAAGSCTFGEVYTTDGRIVALNLKVLKDDKRFFPNYNVSLVVRRSVMKRYPQIAKIIAPVAKKLTTATLLKLNAEVDVDGREPTDVAYDWLKKEGFVS